MRNKEIRRANLMRLLTEFRSIEAFSEKTKMNPQHVSQLKNGSRGIGDKVAEKIEKALGLEDGYLDELRPSGVHDGKAVYKHEPRAIPLISSVRAGEWSESPDIYATGDAEDWLPAPVRHYSEHAFALRVEGPSMDDGSPQGYRDGDLVYVDPEQAINHNDDVVVKNADGETKLKRYIIQGNKAYLLALNKDWPERIVELTADCRIIGRVFFSGKMR